MQKRGRKRLPEEEKQAIGAIYKQYIDTFEEDPKIPRKIFVKSETLYAEKGHQSSDKGQLYTPKPLIKLKNEEPSPERPVSPTLPSHKRGKKKSNLKALGDELKMMQQERQSQEMKLVIPKVEAPPEGDYCASTNLFVSNLASNFTESHLVQLFGIYGPLASVKIMWPRYESNSKSANCGFVAFMSRADAERALDGLKNYENMKISWGKSVKIPSYPVHIPPVLYKLYSPPPPSGLPFNAQTNAKEDEIDLRDTVVKVTIPFDRNQLMLIHRIIEFVILEGPEFEAIIMNMEINNPNFNFLFNFRDPAHIYYRWKLFSLLHGDSKNVWSLKPFRMFKDGSIWVPPKAPNYKDGMPKELIDGNPPEGELSPAEVDQVNHLLRHLTIARRSIAEAMVYCLTRSRTINDALDLIAESVMNPIANPVKKIARLYLLTDVIRNCRVKKIQLRRFDEANPKVCCDIFRQFHDTYKGLTYPQDRECLKIKICTVLRSWVFHNFYDVKFITKLENIFLCGNEVCEDDDNSLNDEPLDGANLLKRSLQTATTDCLIVQKTEAANDNKNKFFDIFNY